MILKDLLRTDLDIVFCGTAAGEVSAKKQAYYSGPGNQFYLVLYSIGLTPELLPPKDYKKLLNYKIGLTDLVKLTSGSDNVLRAGLISCDLANRKDATKRTRFRVVKK